MIEWTYLMLISMTVKYLKMCLPILKRPKSALKRWKTRNPKLRNLRNHLEAVFRKSFNQRPLDQDPLDKTSDYHALVFILSFIFLAIFFPPLLLSLSLTMLPVRY